MGATESERVWEYEGYDPGQEGLREALCTLGNGYLATRGAAAESTSGPVHYPATYAAGVYNRLTSTVAGRQVENEDLVNLPNRLPMRFRPVLRDGTPGRWYAADTAELLDYRQALDLRRATLTRRFAYRDRRVGRIEVEQCRLAHMAEPHLVAERTVVTPTEWSGRIEAASGLDGRVTNDNVRRYRALCRNHLVAAGTGAPGPGTVWLRCRTSSSETTVGVAARTAVPGGPASCRLRPGHRRISHRLLVPAGPDLPAVVEKTAAVYTSRDRAVADPVGAAVGRVTGAAGFPELLDAHVAAWARLWRNADVRVSGEAGRILRLHLFHVLQTLSPHTADLDVGVPARGLHGEAYRGHVFWDELFVLPYLNLHLPEVSRAMLDYRHRRLPAARRAAAAAGRPGARYPWQSGSDGREESQTMHLNPRSGRWLPDHSRLQRHVGSAVAYNVWRYCEATDDMAYLHTRGAEMLLEAARFWAADAAYDPALGRYRIRGVVGPDEYHDGSPDADRPGLDDNAYTNVTAAWVLARALDLFRLLPVMRRGELVEQLGLDDAELDRWRDVSHRLRVPFHRGVISQFDGYGDLAGLDWQRYRERYRDIRRLDRILAAEDDTVDRYQASKQADVLMLGYLFPPAELAGLFRRLGYRLDDEVWRRTVDYYLARTSHGSTLSGLVHGWVLARTRSDDAWRFVCEALEGDVADLQGGTTREGVHLGAMAGTLDLVQRGLAGIEARNGALRVDPAPVPQLSEFGLTLRYRGHWGVDPRLEAGALSVTLPASGGPPVRVPLPGSGPRRG